MIKEDFKSKLITYFFTIVMLISLVVFFMKKETYYIIYVIFIYFTYAIFLYFEGRKILKMKLYIKTLILVTIIIDVVGGFCFKLYDVTKWFDNAIHMFGSFSFTLLLNYIFHVKKISKYKIVIFVYATSLGIATGVFYEFAEFALDMILKTTTQEGLIDTNLDLIFDAFGAMIASILIIYRKDIH